MMTSTLLFEERVASRHETWTAPQPACASVSIGEPIEIEIAECTRPEQVAALQERLASCGRLSYAVVLTDNRWPADELADALESMGRPHRMFLSGEAVSRYAWPEWVQVESDPRQAVHDIVQMLRAGDSLLIACASQEQADRARAWVQSAARWRSSREPAGAGEQDPRPGRSPHDPSVLE